MAAQKLERLKAADVCQIAQLQPYVLRTWEAEFPDLGQATAGGPRIYGRADVERVLRIRELVYVEGLTLAGARRRLEESAGDTASSSVEEYSLVDEQTRTRLRLGAAGAAGRAGAAGAAGRRCAVRAGGADWQRRSGREVATGTAVARRRRL